MGMSFKAFKPVKKHTDSMQWEHRGNMRRGSRKFERESSAVQFLLGMCPVKARHKKEILDMARSRFLMSAKAEKFSYLDGLARLQ
jgi:hypothetical protein